jgi:hypothetical protein
VFAGAFLATLLMATHAAVVTAFALVCLVLLVVWERLAKRR